MRFFVYFRTSSCLIFFNYLYPIAAYSRYVTVKEHQNTSHMDLKTTRRRPTEGIVNVDAKLSGKVLRETFITLLGLESPLQ